MVPRAIQTERTRRRGTVMILVVGVLAMLFIVGSTLLIVSRFERQSAKTFSDGRDLDAASEAIIAPIVEGLREDVVGKDGTPYNRGWTPTETSVMEDYADFPGRGSTAVRSGDFLLSSSEPLVTDNGARVLSASSGPVDGLSTITGVTLPGAVTVGFTSSPPTRDADGDGLVDSADVNAGTLVSMFGSNYEVDLRVESNGGKVLLDPQTPPALLAQVIHQEDWPSGKLPQLFQGTNAVILSATDEANLRRRYMLPKNLGMKADGVTPMEANDLPATDIRNRLQVSLGYVPPSGANSVVQGFNLLTPHWWPAAYDADGGSAWWQARLTPPAVGMDEHGGATTYSATTDLYDRQHLMTVKNSDDILRPDRDEVNRLQAFNTATTGVTYYDILNPAASMSGAENAYGRMRAFDPTATPPTGAPMGVPLFNTVGLRTAFSLRDVLDQEWDKTSPGFFKELASYRRFEQLTAYYLAMIQHTTVPNDEDKQLLIAAQLAVNTIDFADSDSLSSCVRLNLSGTDVTVCGVEKQPYITEAYAKVVYTSVNAGSGTFKWEATSRNTKSIYAVELYNPYDVSLGLDGYVIRTSGGDLALGPANKDMPATIPAKSYIVIANRFNDDLGSTPFIPSTTQHPVRPNQNGEPSPNLYADSTSTLEITAGTSVELVRTGLVDLKGGSIDPIVVDIVKPVGLGGTDAKWAASPASSDDQAGLDGFALQPGSAGEYLVRDSSLQRPKEDPGTDPSNPLPPQYWYFTLSRQMLFPIDDWEDADGKAPWTAPLDYGTTRMAQHNLLMSDPTVGHANRAIIQNRDLVSLEASGAIRQDWEIFPTFPSVVVTLSPKDALAPFPIVTSDRGIDPNTGGCLAFPTTGTLLLVTRYAHVDDGTNSTPVSMAATLVPPGSNRGNGLAQMAQVDNGHMPVFDEIQVAKDSDVSDPRGRFDVPWGQMVYDYFTALPLEELVRPLPQAAIGVSGWPRLIDQTEADYASMYLYNTLFAVYDSGNLSASYPLVAKIDSAASPFGPKINGRINVNIAPWWVLDGLPVLPDAVPSFSSSFTSDNAIPNKNGGVLSGLPVPELESWRLDPAALDKTERAGVQVVRTMIDEEYRDQNPPYSISKLVTVANPKCGMPSVSASLARYMVSYREKKALYDKDANPLADAGNTGEPGFVSTGAICNVLGRIPVLVRAKTDGGSKKDMYLTRSGLREYKYEATKNDENTTVRPFGYVGYLQAIAPMVRLQDWATVKSHVFTIYAVIRSDKEQPGLRTQVTVDRTRCLYTNDLPERITETAPIGYYNSVED